MAATAEASTRTGPIESPPTYAAEWRRGLLVMMPLWIGVVPFGVTFGVVARQAGFGPIDAQLGSLLIFAGSAQMAMIALYEDQAGWLAIVLTALVLNLRHVLYGLSLRRELPAKTRPPLPVVAYFLTDESYGMTVNDAQSSATAAAPTAPRRTDAFLFGASLGLYAVFAVATLIGVTLGALLPDADELGLDLVFPLTFLALLLPLLRTRHRVAVALLAAGLALALGRFGGGIAVLGATLGGAALGAWLEGRTEAAS